MTETGIDAQRGGEATSLQGETLRSASSLSFEERLEPLGEIAERLYRSCLSGTPTARNAFTEEFAEELKQLDQELGITFDCHNFATLFIRSCGVEEVPAVQAAEDHFPISVNPEGYRTYDDSNYDRATAFTQHLGMVIGAAEKAHPLGRDEIRRQIVQFRQEFLDSAGIRFSLPRELQRGGGAARAAAPETDQVLEETVAAVAQAAAQNLGSRLGMIGGVRKGSDPQKFPLEDTHSFIILGPNADQTDLFILDKRGAGTSYTGLRVRTLSQVLHQHRFHGKFDESVIALSPEPLRSVIERSRERGAIF